MVSSTWSYFILETIHRCYRCMVSRLYSSRADPT